MDPIRILCKHAVGGGVAFTIDPNTGDVLTATVRVRDFGPLPKSFDVDAYTRHYGRLHDEIDIRDIGYTDMEDDYTSPNAQYREKLLYSRYRGAVRLLEDVTAALANCVLHTGKPMTEADTAQRNRLCRDVEFFLNLVRPLPAETQADGQATS